MIPVIVAAAALGWFLDGGTAGTPREQQPTAPTASMPVGSAPVTPVIPAVTPVTAGASPDVSWVDLGGFSLPVSRTAGPTYQLDGRAYTFSHDDRGAAFAAVHLLVRTFPFAGSKVFRPTIAEQVVGEHRTALARLTEQAYQDAAHATRVTAGAPIHSDGADAVAGYRLAATAVGSSDRVVGVLIRQTADGAAPEFTEFEVRLTWKRGQWLLVAPPWGDWRAAARSTATADPSVYTSYDAGTES